MKARGPALSGDASQLVLVPRPRPRHVHAHKNSPAAHSAPTTSLTFTTVMTNGEEAAPVTLTPRTMRLATDAMFDASPEPPHRPASPQVGQRRPRSGSSSGPSDGIIDFDAAHARGRREAGLDSPLDDNPFMGFPSTTFDGPALSFGSTTTLVRRPPTTAFNAESFATTLTHRKKRKTEHAGEVIAYAKVYMPCHVRTHTDCRGFRRARKSATSCSSTSLSRCTSCCTRNKKTRQRTSS